MGSRGIKWCGFWRFDLIIFKRVQLLVRSHAMFAIITNVELLNVFCSFDLQVRYNKTTFLYKELTFYQALKEKFTNHFPSDAALLNLKFSSLVYGNSIVKPGLQYCI